MADPQQPGLGPEHGIDLPAAHVPSRSGRETRLLLVTIAVSAGMLLLLAQLRFPGEGAPTTAEPAPAPLERFAARATYDELASIMADLERRIAPSVLVVPTVGENGVVTYTPAVRIAPDRAVALVSGSSHVAPSTGAAATVVGLDAARNVMVLKVDPRPGDVVSPRTGLARPGPRYVAVVEGTARGPAIRPVYVGRTDVFQDPLTGDTLLSVGAVQQSLPRGSAVFSLEGVFIGLTADSTATVTLIPADTLQSIAQSARPPANTRAVLGVRVQPVTSQLARAAGVDSGVMVTHVEPGGPADGVLLSTDVVQAIDGTGTATVTAFTQVAESRTPGTPVRLSIVRGGKPQTVTLQPRPAGAPPSEATDGGFVLRTVQGVGAEVVAVEPRSLAARAGLRRGDLIVALGGESGPSADAITRALRNARSGSVLLTVQRGQEYAVLALEKP